MKGLKKKFEQDETMLGTWVTIQHPDIADIFSTLPFDWLMFDIEHAPANINTLQTMLPAIKGSEISPFARVPWNDLVWIKRVLDVGFEGVLVPYVNTREEAKEVIEACKYPPEGIRGVGPRRATMYGSDDMGDYFKNFQDEKLVIGVQIETEEALENIDEILSLEGIDMAFLGPMDLSANLDVFANFDHPKFKQAVEKILNTCEDKDVVPGTVALSANQVQNKIEEGFKFLSIGADYQMLRDSFSETLNNLEIS